MAILIIVVIVCFHDAKGGDLTQYWIDLGAEILQPVIHPLYLILSRIKLYCFFFIHYSSSQRIVFFVS